MAVFRIYVGFEINKINLKRIFKVLNIHKVSVLHRHFSIKICAFIRITNADQFQYKNQYFCGLYYKPKQQK